MAGGWATVRSCIISTGEVWDVGKNWIGFGKTRRTLPEICYSELLLRVIVYIFNTVT
jgi:hypothetical protein